MLTCCQCAFWHPINGDHDTATNGHCRFHAPAAILPHQLKRVEMAEIDKFALGARAVPPRALQPLHPITNTLWGCGQAKCRNGA